MVDRDLFWPVGLVLEQQGGEAGAGSGRLAATNSCRGASDNGSAAAASVARDVDAGGELKWGAELGSSVPLGRRIPRSAQQGSCSRESGEIGVPNEDADGDELCSRSRSQVIIGSRLVGTTVQHNQCVRLSPTWRQPNCAVLQRDARHLTGP